ncbi:hypothetical protein GCM10010289_83260 [Streptomyces violascens]|uniref:Uncharacterized protein n=1 Tax=Streptomyces violascens TaxID=67381 RepID=A0ABQ3QSZ9_9ACTN|nr:hypothetical protein GCM10010289_83260 [Streptomyces violascens]GHI40354.1 hypothetical protein Sviol_47620 [Streptomyces violascens]
MSAALEGETPTGRLGDFPRWAFRGDGQWNLHEDRFEKAGVSAHYWTHPDGVPRLGAMTSCGRTGPRSSMPASHSSGDPPPSSTRPSSSTVVGRRGPRPGPALCPSSAVTWDGLQLILDTTRAGDAAISEATFCTEEWEI